MEIREVVQLKQEMEQTIRELVNVYTRETGLEIDDILVCRHEVKDAAGEIKCVGYSIRVKVQL